MPESRPIVVEHNGRTLRVSKGHNTSYGAANAYMFGHPLWPGGLRLDGFREGMSRGQVKRLATAAADGIDEHYRNYLSGLQA